MCKNRGKWVLRRPLPTTGVGFLFSNSRDWNVTAVRKQPRPVPEIPLLRSSNCQEIRAVTHTDTCGSGSDTAGGKESTCALEPDRPTFWLSLAPWPWASLSLPWTSVLSCGGTSSHVYQALPAASDLEQVHTTLQWVLTISEGYSERNLEMSWEPWCSGSLDKRQLAPLKGPWSSVRALRSHVKSPAAFPYSCVQISMYGGPTVCRDYAKHRGQYDPGLKSHNLVEKTSFQNNLMSRCKCTSVTRATKERNMAICDMAPENEEMDPVWGAPGWRGLNKTKKKAEEDLSP